MISWHSLFKSCSVPKNITPLFLFILYPSSFSLLSSSFVPPVLLYYLPPLSLVIFSSLFLLYPSFPSSSLPLLSLFLFSSLFILYPWSYTSSHFSVLFLLFPSSSSLLSSSSISLPIFFSLPPLSFFLFSALFVLYPHALLYSLHPLSLLLFPFLSFSFIPLSSLLFPSLSLFIFSPPFLLYPSSSSLHSSAKSSALFSPPISSYTVRLLSFHSTYSQPFSYLPQTYLHLPSSLLSSHLCSFISPVL